MAQSKPPEEEKKSVTIKNVYTLRSHREEEKKSFGQEIHLFLHCHLRGYDKEGKGEFMDAHYYDKYGAPLHGEHSWTEGYYTVEQTLNEHNRCMNMKNVDFPRVAGYGGGAHLYKAFHHEGPWNRTGWIPLQRSWIFQDKENRMSMSKNRAFPAFRGNEIQNDLWDYSPFDQQLFPPITFKKKTFKSYSRM